MQLRRFEPNMDQLAIASACSDALKTVLDELARAVEARKCHPCGCLRTTLDAMDQARIGVPMVQEAIDDARKVVQPTKYDCLGCDVCHPAVAANALAEAFPMAALGGALCPTDTPAERAGWPPLPGDYTVLRCGASVAVCTLNSGDLSKDLARRASEGLAIVGTMRTENLGIERVIRNVLANPNIRWLVLCGDDTRQLVGHLPGQCMEALFAGGIDDSQRIVGARGKRPYLKNVSPQQVQIFREQVQLVSMIGEGDAARISEVVERLHRDARPAYDGSTAEVAVETVNAREPQFFKSDPAGFLVVYPDSRCRNLVVEHYTNAAVLDCVVRGTTPAAVYMEIIHRGLVTQLDHAAYLGRELANAERSIRTGRPYVQDRAPGEPEPSTQTTGPTSCGPGCTTCH